MKKAFFLLLSFCISYGGIESLASEIREPYKKIKPSSLYTNKKCIRLLEREEYIPGSFFSPGYVKYWKEHINIKCPKEVEVRNCFVLKYNEEYIPGTDEFKGYVQSWHQEISIPCGKDKANQMPKNLNRKSKRNGLW